MNDKKYQVFISSTYTDLAEERKKILDVLFMADCIPAGMEAFVAADTEQFDVIKKVIDLCDYYVLIIGKRYGSVHPDTGKSYTEMEYRYAIEKSIPVLIFLHNDIGAIHLDKSERNEQNRRKLEKFMQDVSKDRMVKYWNGKEDLARKVSTTMFSVMERHPAAGWIKGTPFLEEMVSTYDKNDSRIEDELAEIAYHCKMQENFKQAHLFLKWGYLLSPENINVLREYGGLCYDEKNYAQALVYWEKLLSLQESCGNYYICALT